MGMTPPAGARRRTHAYGGVARALLALLVTVGAPQVASAQVAGDGAPVFIDVSASAGIDATHRAVWDVYDAKEGYLAAGQAWADYDGDGWLDLYVTGNLDPNVLFRNRGDGTFSRSPFSDQVALPGVTSGGATWADVDNDGWRDLYVVADGRNTLFRNLAGGGFEDVTERAGVGDGGKGKSAAWGDYDGDGFLDLYVVNWSCIPECDPEDEALSQDRLYRNEGDGSFTDVSHLLDHAKLVGAGFAAVFLDVDDDGRLDLYVVNDKVRTPIGNVLWRNDGPGCGGWCWTDVSRESGADTVMHAMGIAVGDYDNDGSVDFYVSNMMNSMVLLRSQGDGTFRGAASPAGVAVNPPGEAVGWGTAFLDFDNDGWLDLYLAATGMPFLSGSFYRGVAPDLEDFRHPYPDGLFRNQGDGTFADAGAWALPHEARPSMGFAYADYDGDGFVDFVVGIWDEGYALYRNRGTAGADHHWITLRLIGGGPVNRDAVGAKAYVTDSDGRTQVRHVVNGSSLGAGNDLALHFGLGAATVEEIRIVWPDGVTRRLGPTPHDRILEVRYP
jgi:enediyne biosynthesis protein E4